MSLIAGDKIKPGDMASSFSANVVATILANTFHSTNVPYFSGTVYRNSSYQGNDNVAAFADPAAVPLQDLDAYAEPIANIGTAGERVTGATVYTALTSIVTGLSRVRNFNSYWYHQNNASFSLVATKSGKAIFKPSLAALPVYSAIGSSAVAGWERDVNIPLQTINVDGSDIQAGKAASAANIVAFFNRLKAAWTSASVNAITYKLYTCHRNCHNNCHGSRGRR